MNAMITFPRIGVDGKTYTQKDIEDAFVNNLEQEINDALNQIKTKYKCEKRIVKLLKRQVRYLLTAKPVSLERIKNSTDRLNFASCAKHEKRIKVFKREIQKAFNYDKHRKDHLVEHAVRLNVKTCCYCNMNYTLLIEENQARSIKKKALLQFDHFYDKNKYPHLSMSMYNLIPSCATCNQGKPRTCNLSLLFNPFYSNIFELYKFRVKKPLPLFMGITHPEKIEVECKPLTTKKDVLKYVKWFHISSKYGVHKDIVQEVFDKAQQYPYYAHFMNFAYLNEESYPLRLLLGVYPDINDFAKRPMSKFVMDIWEQACIHLGKKK